MDQRYQIIYGIRRSCWTSLSTYFTQACKLVCMHSMCLRAQAHISAKLGRIREIKISMESGEHAGPLWACNLIQACKLVCMHAMCLCARAHISAKLGHIREIKVSMVSGEHAGPLGARNFTKAHKLACMHAMCLRARAILQPNWVGSEIWRYLWNPESIPDLSEYIMWPRHTS